MKCHNNKISKFIMKLRWWDYFADIIVNNRIIIEIKAAEGLREENKAQLINYLKATDKEIGLLLNFGKSAEFKRVIFTNDRKEIIEIKSTNPSNPCNPCSVTCGSQKLYIPCN